MSFLMKLVGQIRTKMSSTSGLGWPRKKRNDKPVTPLQTGLGKRMEFYWPGRTRRTRIPLYENSARNLVLDHRLQRWLVMWYRHGIQVFRAFPFRGRAENFEKSKIAALTLLKQLVVTGKLGSPGPDKCMSGYRGVG
jgi:hypothetical protein